MPRTPLPYRRLQETIEIGYAGQTYTICVGFDNAGRPREVFCDCDRAKEGSAMQALADDVCILISVALQHDVGPGDLMKSLGRVPAYHDGRPVETWASVAGVIVAALEPQLALVEARRALESSGG